MRVASRLTRNRLKPLSLFAFYTLRNLEGYIITFRAAFARQLLVANATCRVYETSLCQSPSSPRAPRSRLDSRQRLYYFCIKKRESGVAFVYRLPRCLESNTSLCNQPRGRPSSVASRAPISTSDLIGRLRPSIDRNRVWLCLWFESRPRPRSLPST